ncbi:hypothetical protein VKT23_007896 [Stygiomarasmius scandens]|uniref:F-box domain-containing protein n=1 Tax=Marasmiellus scandens TaxID=2682957 RepID=A0ABR1JKW6_9AGAR
MDDLSSEPEKSIVHTAPPEILIEIFHHCIQSRGGINVRDSTGEERLGSTIYLPAVVILSQVCWSWRRIVETQSSLWTQVQLLLFTERSRDPALFIEWLGRSGGLPLDITIKASSYFSSKRLDDFVDALISVSPRWRSLRFEPWILSSHIQRLLDDPEVRTPLLEGVVLSCNHFATFPSLSVIEKAPRLVKLKIVVAVLDGFSPAFSRVTHLYHVFRPGHPLDILRILEPCHSLQGCSLCLRDLSDDPSREIVVDVIEFPRLHDLSIEFYGFGCPQFFDGLKLPSLTKLTIQHRTAYDRSLRLDLERRISPLRYLTRLYSRSSFELLELNLLATTGASSKDLLDFLRQTPSLQTLHLKNCRLETDVLFRALRVSKSMQDEDIIVPCLTKLRYIQSDELDLEEDANHTPRELGDPDEQKASISSMVASRFDPKEYTCGGSEPEDDWQGSWPVRRLRGGLFVSRRVLDSGDIDRLNVMKEHGMPFEIV